LILSLIFQNGIVNPAKYNALQRMNWCLAASINSTTCSFTANDKPFLCIITEAFIRLVFLDLCHIMNFYDQENKKKAMC
jgi:hypothetical protein